MGEEGFDRKKFDGLAQEIRYITTDMICSYGQGHLGGSVDTASFTKSPMRCTIL